MIKHVEYLWHCMHYAYAGCLKVSYCFANIAWIFIDIPKEKAHDRAFFVISYDICIILSLNIKEQVLFLLLFRKVQLDLFVQSFSIFFT